MIASTPGLGNLFTITDGMNCALLLAGSEINSFFHKILPFANYGEE